MGLAALGLLNQNCVCICESFLKVFAFIEALSYRDHVESLKQGLVE
jgi:hypothetical protein